MKRSNLAWLLVVLTALVPIGSNGAATQSGVGSARASAIPLRLSVGGVSADLLDISLSATTDPQRTGASARSANAKLTALRVQGPQPLTAGELESGAGDGEADQDESEDVPLDAPGIVLATLQSATSAASVDEDGSRASVGAKLVDFSLGGGLIRADTITSEMTVSATATTVTATKVVDLPSVTALRVGDLAEAAGVLMDSLTVEELLDIANTLALESTGDFGDLLAEEQDQSSQLQAAQDALTSALAEQAEAQAALAEAENALADAQAQLPLDQASAASASAQVDTAQTAVADAQSDLAAAQAELDAAEVDLATLESLTLLTPGAVATLQGLAAEYGVGGTVTFLNFATKLMEVGEAVNDAVDAAQAAVDVAQTELAAADAALSSAQAALAAANAAVEATQDAIDALLVQIASLTDTLAASSAEIAGLQATVDVLATQLSATVAALGSYTEELRAIVGDAPIVTFEGVHIELHANASATGGVPNIVISFDRLSLGTVSAAQNVSTTEAAITLLPQIAEVFNSVGSVLGLPAMDVGVLDTDSTSGTDADGYRYASASFALLTVSVPTPDGATLTLSIGDPEVFAEFAPSPGGGGPGGGGPAPGTGGGDDSPGTLPNTGLATPALPAAVMLTAAAALIVLLARRRRA